MVRDLVVRREQAMDRADRALDAAWPERKGTKYVSEMQAVAKDLKSIATEMRKQGVKNVELSRTYSCLGNIYSDLAPALGRQMLQKAKGMYLKSEALLKGYGDELDHAKLNFNYANTLRQIDPDDIDLLQEAKRRFLFAQRVFAKQAPQYLDGVKTALWSVDSLLAIAPVAGSVQRNLADYRKLEKEISKGENLAELIVRARELMNRDGGAANLVGKVKNLLDGMPPEIKQSDKYLQIQKQMQSLTSLALGGGARGDQEAKILSLLKDRVQAEFSDRKLTKDHTEALNSILEDFGRILSGEDDDLQACLNKLQKMREMAGSQVEILHYLSHGIDRPPPGSRAAELVELCWSLRRYIIEEQNRAGKGPVESKEALELNIRATEVDRRIYEAGRDNKRAVIVEKEELRPLACTVRSFAARRNPMLASPIWMTARIPVDTAAVLFSGSSKLRSQVAKACRSIGLVLLQESRGRSIAPSRWQQIQKAITTIFDLSVRDGRKRASITYELGIALAIGKPVVVITNKRQKLPFDIDVEPVELLGGSKDLELLSSAIGQSITTIYPLSKSEGYITTTNHALSLYARPHSNLYVNQTFKLLEEQQKSPDPLAVTRILTKLLEVAKDRETQLIQPKWSAVYPDVDHPRLFHVMPFRPKWAKDVTKATRKTCDEVGIDYIRGDEVEDPNIIRSIWEQIARAAHVLVDLTGFNENVALELGIAHTLGRPSLIVGQPNTAERLFPMIAKLRLAEYADMLQLRKLVREFVS